MTTLREAAQQALRVACMCTPEQQIAKEALRAALAQEEPTVRYKCTVVDAQHPNGVPFEQWVNAPQEEQEPEPEPVTQMRENALARWAHEQEEPPDTDWQRGYEAARRWVRQVGLPSLAQQTQTPCDIAEDGVCEVIDCCRNSAQAEQEPVAYTGDVARRMREAEMTFHLGMPHAVVMQQMTRFHDLVCAEASLRAAAAFAIPPRREWQGLTTQEAMTLTDTVPRGTFYGCDAGIGLGIWIAAVAAAERALKEKNA